MSDDPQDFFSKVDIVIFFQSTLGFEAMMCGIPSVSLSPMININTPFNKVTSRNYVKPSHKASSFSELDRIVDLRAQNKLALADDLSEYVKVAKDYFYNQTFDDRFSERLVNLVSKLDNYNIASVESKMIWSHAHTPRIAKFLLATTKKFRLSYKIVIKFSKFHYRKLSNIYFG